MKTIKGPAIFLAQFVGDDPPFNTLNNIAKWAADLGFKGVQIPTWDSRLFDLEKAANSQSYCTEILETLDNHGLVITELSTHIQGQLVAVHPAYDTLFDSFAVPEVAPMLIQFVSPTVPILYVLPTFAYCGSICTRSGRYNGSRCFMRRYFTSCPLERFDRKGMDR